MLSSHSADSGMPDDADTLPMGNEIAAALWDNVVAAYREGGRLVEQRDAGVRRELETIARLFDAVIAGSNDVENTWFRFLERKGVRRTRRRRDGKRSLFYGLIEHLSNEHAKQDETRSKSVISRRAAVLQHWHDQERAVAANQVAGWIATNGGIKAVAALANPPKPLMTKAQRNATRADREASFHQLVEHDPLTSMNWDVLPDNLRPFADGEYRLALIRVRETNADAGAVDIIGMADDRSVSQRWLNRNARGIVERLPDACRDCEAAEDVAEPSEFSGPQFFATPSIEQQAQP